MIVVPGAGESVVALDLASREAAWSRPDVIAIGDGPDVVIVVDAARSETLSVLDRRTGRELWSLQSGDVVAAGAAGSVVVVVGADSTKSYDARTGAPRWERPFTQVSAVEPRTGQVRWSMEGAPFGHGGGGEDFVLDGGPGLLLRYPLDRSQEGATLTAIDPLTGSTAWSRPIGELSLPASSGQLEAPTPALATDDRVLLTFSHCPGND